MQLADRAHLADDGGDRSEMVRPERVPSCGTPLGPSGTPMGPTQLSTRLTSCSLLIARIWLTTEETVASFDGNTLIERSDGFVLARNVANDAWVRRAAAIDAIAVPPIRPTSSTMAR